MSAITLVPSTSWEEIQNKSNSRVLVLVTKEDFFEKDLFEDEIYERKSSIQVSRNSTLPNEDHEENCETQCTVNLSDERIFSLNNGDGKKLELGSDTILSEEPSPLEIGRIVNFDDLFYDQEEAFEVSKFKELKELKEKEDLNKADGTYDLDAFSKTSLSPKQIFGRDSNSSKKVDIDNLFTQGDEFVFNTRNSDKNSVELTDDVREFSSASTAFPNSLISKNAYFQESNEGDTTCVSETKELNCNSIIACIVKQEVLERQEKVEDQTTKQFNGSKIKELLENNDHISLWKELEPLKAKESFIIDHKTPTHHKFNSHLSNDFDYRKRSVKLVDTKESMNGSRKGSFNQETVKQFNNDMKNIRSRLYSNSDNSNNNNQNTSSQSQIIQKISDKLLEPTVESPINIEDSRNKSAQKEKDDNKYTNIKATSLPESLAIPKRKEKYRFDKKSFAMRDNTPCVGVGIFLVDQKKERLLLGRRIDSGLYGLPGGWIEFGEEWEECSSRELKEETGITKPPSSFKHIYTLNYHDPDKNFHAVSCVMYCAVEESDLYDLDNKEPNKCYGWFWINVSEMRSMSDQLFPPLRKFVKQYPKIKKASEFKTYFKAKIDLDSLFENESIMDF